MIRRLRLNLRAVGTRWLAMIYTFGDYVLNACLHALWRVGEPFT
jgi:hypothetical protein